MKMKKNKNQILVVDDNKVVNKLLLDFIAEIGHEGVGETNPENVLDLIKENKFDLVLLDITMPNIIGTDLLTDIRKTKSSVELPVIMITGRSDNNIIEQCRESGANDFITKPFNYPVLQSRIQSLLMVTKLGKVANTSKPFKTIHALLAKSKNKKNNPKKLIIEILQNINKAYPDVSTSTDELINFVKKIK